jgi:hypothetical protein
MISELNNNIDRGFRYGGEKNETLIAKIFYYQVYLTFKLVNAFILDDIGRIMLCRLFVKHCFP